MGITSMVIWHGNRYNQSHEEEEMDLPQKGKEIQAYCKTTVHGGQQLICFR